MVDFSDDEGPAMATTAPRASVNLTKDSGRKLGEVVGRTKVPRSSGASGMCILVGHCGRAYMWFVVIFAQRKYH